MIRLQLGNVTEGVAAIGTVGALWVGAVTIRRDQRTRQKQDEDAAWDEALKVTVSQGVVPVGTGTTEALVSVTVVNNGRREIRDARVDVYAENDFPLGSYIFNAVPAGAVRTHQFPKVIATLWHPEPVAHWDTMPSTISFSDVGGRKWRRDAEGNLHREP